MAEELGFQKVFRKGAAIDGDPRPAASLARPGGGPALLLPYRCPSHRLVRPQEERLWRTFTTSSAFAGSSIAPPPTPGSAARPWRREVAQAMAEASQAFVDILELVEAVGKRLADLTRNEAAYVSNGAAAGLSLATAAAIAGDDPALIARLPNDMDGLKSEVVVHRHAPDLVRPGGPQRRRAAHRNWPLIRDADYGSWTPPSPSGRPPSSTAQAVTSPGTPCRSTT